MQDAERKYVHACMMFWAREVSGGGGWRLGIYLCVVWEGGGDGGMLLVLWGEMDGWDLKHCMAGWGNEGEDMFPPGLSLLRLGVSALEV